MLLVSEDFAEPDTIEPGDYLVGQQPRLHHLVDGYFAPRAALVAEVAKACLRWIESDPFQSDRMRRLPVFWIVGRSGSGKSVLLLQLMARLIQNGVGPVLWLGNSPRRLPGAMAWATEAVAAGAHPVICIDDPYAPGDEGVVTRYWHSAIDEVVKLQNSADRVPLVLVCSPEEQADNAERELREDITIQRWRLDDESDDVEALLDWFTARTGRRPPEFGLGNILMVQRFFEWRTGEPLRDFAERFQARVETVDRQGEIAPFLLSLLAVNRLYAGFPERALQSLSASSRDALEVFARDQHIAIDAEGGRVGLWLAHPHLADALFCGWLPPRAVHQRADALSGGIERCRIWGETPSEQTAPLWALWRARQTAADSLVSERVDWPETHTVLRTAYEASAASEAGIPLAHLPVWIHLALDVLPTPLRPPPVQFALDELGSGELDRTGTRLTCHILLHHLQDMGRAQRAATLHTIRRLLETNPDWHEWPPVALDLASRTQADSDAVRLLHWVDRYADHWMVPTILRQVLANPNLAADALKISTDRADTAGDAIEWIRLYESVLDQESAQIPPPILRWAKRCHLAPRLPFVLARLFERDVAGAEEMARAWLERHPGSAVANYLLEPLLAAHPEDAGLFELAVKWVGTKRSCADRLLETLLERDPCEPVVSAARAWLGEHEDQTGWSFVLQKLLDVVEDGDQRAELVQRGVAWLDGREDHAACSHVLRKLLDVVEDGDQRAKMVQHGVAWLDGREDHASWAYVLQKLLDVVEDGDQRAELVQHGVAWLDGRDDHASWAYVLQKLLDVVEDGDQRAELVQHGVAWLDGRDDHAAWNYVLQKLLDVVEDGDQRAELVQRGVAWLDDREDHAAWNYVLQKLLDVVENADQRAEVAQPVVAWLDGREDHRAWRHVLQKLLDVVEDADQRAKVVQHGVAWLEGREDHASWAYVLQKLLDVVEDADQKMTLVQRGVARAELVQRGVAWLDGRDDHAAWNYVLQKLLDVVEDGDQRAKVVQHGVAWLDDREDHAAWNYVLQKLLDVVENADQRAKVVQHGVAWLDGRDDHAAWNYVLQKLLDVVEDGDQRAKVVQHGVAWLDGREEQTEWPHVLATLLDDGDLGPHRAGIVQTAGAWLRTNEANSTWGLLLQSAMSHGSRGVALPQLLLLCSIERRHHRRYLGALISGLDEPSVIELFGALLDRWDPSVFPSWPDVAGDLIDAVGETQHRHALSSLVAAHQATREDPRFEACLAVMDTRLGGRDPASAAPTHVFSGTIESVKAYGLFVRTEVGTGLLHCFQIPPALLPGLMEAARQGHPRSVRLWNSGVGTAGLAFAHPDFVPQPMRGPARPAVADVVEAPVTWTVGYGAYLDVGGVAGWLHKSKLVDPAAIKTWRVGETRAVRILAWQGEKQSWELAHPDFSHEAPRGG